MIADAFLQQILLRPAEYDVIACMNLNGDYISDAPQRRLAVSVSPTAQTSVTNAPCLKPPTVLRRNMPVRTKLTCVLLFSAEMMLRHMGWTEAADLIVKGMEGAINAKTVTYDFERLMEGAKLLKCSEFGDAIIKNM